MVKNFFAKFYIFLIFAFLYAPILVLIVYSFNGSKSRSHWTGFSLEWYVKLFQNQEIMTALYYTLLIALIAAILATIIGTAAAIGLHEMQKTPKAIFLEINYLPVLNPDIVTGISLMLLFIFIHLPLGFTTMLLAHITFCVPYVILSVLPKLRQLDHHVYEAALDLGAKPLYAIWRVILPEIRPGIITGALFAFTLSLDDFVISFFTTGNGVSNLSIAVYSMARRGISPEINAVSTIMFVTVVLLLIIVDRRMKRDSKNKQQNFA